MLLIVTGKDDVTADLVAERLEETGANFARLNTDEYPGASQITTEYDGDGVTGSLRLGCRHIDFGDITTVWYRKPNPPTISDLVHQPEARSFATDESRAMLHGVYRLLSHAFWVSCPDAIRRANDKLYQLSVARGLGFEIPRTMVTNDPDEASAFCSATPTPNIIKPLKAGMVEYPDGKVELIYTSLVTADDLANIAQVAYAPCLLQDYVPKQHEIRVTIIGRRVFAVGLDSQKTDISRHDWRRNACQSVTYFETSIPDDLIQKCFAFMDHYDLQFSAFDFVSTPENKYVFLENNPNGQWAWMDLEIGNGMIQYMAEFLASGGRS